MNPFRRRPVDTRKPLMPGRKTRRRMFRLHFYLGFLVIVGWGFVWAGIEYAFDLKCLRPTGLTGFSALPLDAPPGLLDWWLSQYNPKFWLSQYTLLNNTLNYSTILITLGSLVIDLLVVLVISLAFGILCHRKRNLSALPFIVLVFLLMVNSIASLAYSFSYFNSVGMTRLTAAMQHASNAYFFGDLDRRDKWAAEARRLVREGAQGNGGGTYSSSLEFFADLGDVETMQTLLAHDAIAGASSTWDMALCRAVWEGQVEAAELLLDHGAELDKAITEVGRGPEDTAMAEMLIARGADVNETGFRFTPLENAIISNNYEVGRFLVEHGADIDTAEKGIQSGQRPGSNTAILGERMLMRLRALEVESATEAAP